MANNHKITVDDLRTYSRGAEAKNNARFATKDEVSSLINGIEVGDSAGLNLSIVNGKLCITYEEE